jgi:hypothetical protein
MLRGMWRLTTKNDVLPPLITVMLALMVGGILCALIADPGRDRWVLVTLATISVLVVLWMLSRVWRRYRRLRRGRCPYPLCRGVVQRSERVDKGYVVCPTCQRVWPEVKGMQFRLSARG